MSNSGKFQRAHFWPELGYDTHYFNPDAYENLVKFAEQDPDEIMIVIDGALTRLDRPEVLNKRLSHWDDTDRECHEASELIPNYEQSQHMRDIQFEILRERMAELRKRLPDREKHHLVLCINNDDTQFTASKLLLDLLIHRKATIALQIKVLSETKKRISVEQRKSQQTVDAHKKVTAKFNKTKQDRAVLRAGKAARTDLGAQIKHLRKVQAKVIAKQEELNLYREQKIRPKHQHLTKTLVEDLQQRYRAICKDFNIKYIDRPGRLLKFGKAANDYTIKYAHSGHKTWAAVRGREKSFTKSVVQANQIEHDNEIKKITAEAVAQRVHSHVESGHAGAGFTTTQKLKDHPAETNFKGNSSYDPTIAGQEEYVDISMAIPFEDQTRIASFVENNEQVRMSLGKPGGTRSHAVFDRFMNNSVSGLMMKTRSLEDGRIWTRYIQYQDFVDGTVLEQPERYWTTWLTSDEHLGAEGENPMVRDGMFALYEEHAKKPFSFHGKPAQLAGFISGGDTGEAMSISWNRRYDDRRDPQELLQEYVAQFSQLNPGKAEEVLALAIKMVSDTMGGNPSSMRVVMERVATYYWRFLNITLKVSPWKWAHVSVPGNHADGELQKIGLRETDFFGRDLKAKEIGVFEVGISERGLPDSQVGARVGLGGYGDARIIQIKDYGIGVGNKPLPGQVPINLVVQHDPSGPDMEGIIGAGRQAGADLTLSGHTHVNGVQLYRTKLNQWSVACRLSTLQGVTMTQKKYAGTLARTQAGCRIIMPKPGNFAIQTLSAADLREVGQQYNLEQAKAEVAKAKQE